jgi:hypothetical protein
MASEPGNVIDTAFIGHLIHANTQEAARAKVREHVHHGDAATAEQLARALLAQPYAQLRAHGLLAARLAGRTDIVLGALLAQDTGTWRQAAVFVCQVRDRAWYRRHGGQRRRARLKLKSCCPKAPSHKLLLDKSSA